MTHTIPPSLDMLLNQLTGRMLSPLSRYGHVALLLAASLMSVLIAALLVTETGLPARTQAAFSVLLGIGAAWVVYAIWVLRQRRPLMARHRIVAGWMAVVFTSVFLAGAAAMAVATASPMFRTAAATGAGLLLLAIAALVQAYARVAELRAQRQLLERQLAG